MFVIISFFIGSGISLFQLKIWLNFSNYAETVNRAQKKFSAVAAWENSKKASVEAQLRKMEVILLLFF